jgi:hypothetical protein
MKKDNLKQNLEVVVNDLKILKSRASNPDFKQRLDNCIRLLEKWF